MGKVLLIASGESVADYLRNDGADNVYAFNEAMCEGDAAEDIFSREFCEQRAKAYDIREEEYIPFSKSLMPLLNDTDKLELFFDHDMFCAVNTITLLAFLEKADFKGDINFNLVVQDGTATVLKSFPITLGNFADVYQKVLVERMPAGTGIEHLDKGINMYLEYKQPDNEIVQYIRKNSDLSRTELCGQILMDFAEYGVGDASVFRLIDMNR